jgi:hypothetical protein
MSKVILPGSRDELEGDDHASAWRPKFVLWALGVVCLLLIWWWFQSEPLPPSHLNASESQLTKVISELAAKHHAEVNWASTLSSDLAYSIEVERTLVRNDEKPIVFVGRIMDVRRRDRDIIVDMEAESDVHVPFLRFSLRCPSDIADRLLTETKRNARYVGIALIQSVSKARFRMDATGQVIGEDEVETELEIAAGDYFVANGQCIDLQKVP